MALNMHIRYVREMMDAPKIHKKDELRFLFGKDVRDGTVIERDGIHTMHIKIDAETMTRRKLVLLIRRTVREAMAKRYRMIAFDFNQFRFERIVIDEKELAELLATNLIMAGFEFRDFLSVPNEGWPEISDVMIAGRQNIGIKNGLKRGIIIGEEVNRTRHIADMPGGEMTPALLARHARQAAKGLPITYSVLDVKAMERLGMRGVIGVGKGSDSAPKFIILEYFGAVDKKAPPMVLVGKGVTFDTGGINLKPSNAILGMNMDMSGGAAVIHAIIAAARLGIRKNIVALIPAAENMPSGSSYRPGDVIRSMSGKTIEVQDTDAEGRIILADALHYAKRYKPSLVVDVATLTGASMVALGERASAIFTEDETLERLFRVFGEESGDYVWPLPLWDEYDADIQGEIGDIANLGKTRWGGAITAAVFLKQFVHQEYRWVHIDMAPRMTAVSDEFLGKGAAGAPVRLLIKALESLP
jgi:leucyl aminopeptidase